MKNLNDSLFLLTGAFDMLPDAIVVVDQFGKIQNSNKQVQAVFGYTADELTGKNLDILLPERFRNGHTSMVAGFIKNGHVRKMGSGMSLFGQHRSGAEFNIDIAISVVHTGSETYAIAVIRDITDKINLATQVTQMETIKNELEQFAYILTHDLKAPLVKVKAITQLLHLELSDQESEEIHTMMGYLNDSVSGMESLIYGVLDYYKAKIARNVAEEPVDLEAVFEESLKMIIVPDNYQVVKLKTLPTIRGNKTLLIQVFMNLIYNAISHNTNSQGILEIDWTLEGDTLVFGFSDNGKLIPAENRERIFELSTQLAENPDKKSHGLGLAIVKQIVVHNRANRIWCEESPLGGNSFRFSWAQ